MLLGGFGRDRDDDREGGGFAALLMIFLAPVAALLLQLFVSRAREYSADETGARMVGQPYGLISALEKLGAYNQRLPTTSLSPSTSALCIVKPLFGGGLVLAVQHPSPAGEAHPGSAGDDRYPTARRMRPDSAHFGYSTCNLFGEIVPSDRIDNL